MSDPNLSSFLWSVADLLRGDYKQSEYWKVILPFTVLRRLDCVLEKTKPAVLTELATRKKARLKPEPLLLRKAGQLSVNTSPLDMKKLLDDQDRQVDGLMTAGECLRKAGLDWGVAKVPLRLNDEGGLPLSGISALVRTDKSISDRSRIL